MKYLCTMLLWAISATAHGSDAVSTAIASYFEDFNRGVPALELVMEHWHPESVIFNPDGIMLFSSHNESAAWVEEVQLSIAKDGWVRSEVLESAVCHLGETLALYSMRFRRIFSNGSETVSGGTYTLSKSDKWRIASVTFANPVYLVRCDGAKA